jgi:hypothetical protein
MNRDKRSMKGGKPMRKIKAEIKKLRDKKKGFKKYENER